MEYQYDAMEELIYPAEMAVDFLTGDAETQWGNLVSLKLLTRNTRLVEARKAKGVTQVQMAKDIGMSPQTLSHVENLRFIPKDEEMAEIAAYLVQAIDYLFPDVLIEAIKAGVFRRRDAQLREPEIISLTEAQQLLLTYDMEEEVDNHKLYEEIDQVLATLEPREAEVLRVRFGFDGGPSATLEEAGRVFGVTRERIRQIEAKALRKLRHPSRSRKLKDFLL